MVHRSLCAFVLGLTAYGAGSASAFAFDRVQPPELDVGKRGALAGTLASTSYGPSDVSRGGFTLATPFQAPKERGELLAQVFPSYSPDNGISVWGMGFGTSLALTRWRATGSLAFDFDKGDELTGPFGRMTRGNDGNWYPVGLARPVRVVASGDDLVAYQPDGTKLTFGGAARIVSANGTYAWHLREVRDPAGHVTTLTWVANATGNLFLTTVAYGGRATPQYRIDITYDLLSDVAGAAPRFVDYRSGGPVALDRRVRTVTIQELDTKTGAYAERYHYALQYTEESVGAAFYLTRIDTTFPSGQSAPPVTYRYNLKGAELATTDLREVPQLTALFRDLGVTEDVVQPWRAAVLDADADGNADLELGDDDRTLLMQKGSGTSEDPLRYDVSKLPPPSAPPCSASDQLRCVFDGCRPTSGDGSFLAPRLLSQMNPLDSTVQVAQFQYNSDSDQTAISVCARDGVRLSRQVVDTSWTQSDFVRFVDLNNDHLPDLVRFGFGRYEILPNVAETAGGEARVAWGSLFSGALLDSSGEQFIPSAMWVSDMSGDTIPDLVAQTGDSLQVWHGLGNFQFEIMPQVLRFVDTDGNTFGNLDHYKLIPADLNKDGLQDYFLTNADSTYSRFISYFTNVGGRFVQTPVRALDNLPDTASAPVVAALDGLSNTSVTITDSGKAYSVSLDGPGTGLMANADDGKGTVLSFEYERGPASPGVRHRHALLATMRVQSSGYDTIAYDYRYEHPTLHSLGHFLLGFGSVTRREGDLPAAPLGVHTMTFLNEDHAAGLLLSGTESDVRLPAVVKVESREYEDASFVGIPYKRLKRTSSGWASADGSNKVLDVTQYDSYAADFCPSHTTLTTNHGTLITETTRAAVPALANHLHCLESHVTQTGSHLDTSLNFVHERAISRNAIGLVSQIALLGPMGPMVDEDVEYDGDFDVVRVSTPAKGATRVEYEPSTKLPVRITGPDGAVTRVAARDSRTDATLDHVVERGATAFHEYARYDGMERLDARWSDFAGSPSVPHEQYTYTYASTNRPAATSSHELVDGVKGVFRDTTELYTAADERIGTGRMSDAGWVLDGFVARSRSEATRDRFEVKNQPGAAPLAGIDYASLLQGSAGAGPARVARDMGSSLGIEVSTATEIHADVEKRTDTSLAVTSDGMLSRATLVKGSAATTTLLDATGKLTLGYLDEAGTKYTYSLDALGRARIINVPDGSHHRVAFDEYGRVRSIVREGVASIVNTFAPAPGGGTTELVATRTFSSAPAAPDASIAKRAITWAYDGAGRKLRETHTDLATSSSKTFTFFYDGATPTQPTARGAFGLLTGVSGDGYTKSFGYRADGKLVRRDVELVGFRTLTTEITYREDGGMKDQTLTVRDAGGNVLTTSAHHEDLDTFGRLSKLGVNGAPLATLTYDAFGRVDKTHFATGDDVAFQYDSLTRELAGFDQTRAGGAWGGIASTRVKKNNRGFIGEETLGVGPSSVRRTYDYLPQGFVTLATDGSSK